MVALIATYQHSFFLPIFLGLFTWLKATLGAWLKLVTPKLGVALLKNSFAIKLRDVVVKGLTEFAVFSHRPWRRRIMALKKSVTDSCLSVLRVYLGYPLWLRCLIAISVLTLTASSTWAVLALLIVPQPIIEWLKLRATVILRKLGVLKSLDTLSRRVVPAPAQARWDRYRRWTLGRRQIRASRELHAQLGLRVKAPLQARLEGRLQAGILPDILPVMRRDKKPSESSSDNATD